MLRIHNIEKLEGAKLDKWNIVVNSIKAISIVDGPDYGEYYEFRLSTPAGVVRIVRLDREYELWNDGEPIYRLFNPIDPNKKVTLNINALKNRDIVIDKLRFVGIN